MYEISENKSLKNYNTFGFDVKCKFFVECFSVEDLIRFYKDIEKDSLPVLILGGGSNVLFSSDFDGYVLRPQIKGIEVLEEDNKSITVKVGAGEDWDEFVEYCVNNGWYGVENLSLIPGNVGTCPIQNIGAYGVEVKDVILQVETLGVKSFETKIYNNNDCEFGYRDSIFKRKLKNREIITYVIFRLQKNADLKLHYGNLSDELKRYSKVDLVAVRKAVIDIRESKLPKPEELGNAGSFFKNPVVEKSVLETIQNDYPDIPFYNFKEGYVKIPAGWLIETAGYKGRREGDTGVHEKQALVLVNYGNATGEEVLHLARNIQQSIIIMFGIELEMEVNIVS